MALVTLVSAAGSPGVTTTGLGLALCWPRPVVLVEADPAGSSALAAGYFRGQVDHAGLVDLAMAHRSGLLAEALPRIVMGVPDTDVSILFGSRSHEQAPGLARLWEPLLRALREVAADGQDVIVDGGRLGLSIWPRQLVAHSDLTLLVTRSTLPALVAARSWAESLAEDVLPGHDVKLLLVGEGQPYRAGEVAKTLGLGVAATVGWDPARAAVYSQGADKPAPRFGGAKAADRAFRHSAYAASLQRSAEAIGSLTELTRRDTQLFRGLIAARTRQEVSP